jgi:hypothetical protein
MAKDLHDSMIKRCESYCEINELIVATFLDPRFRHFKFVTDKEKKRRLIEKGQNYIKIFANIIVNQM